MCSSPLKGSFFPLLKICLKISLTFSILLRYPSQISHTGSALEGSLIFVSMAAVTPILAARICSAVERPLLWKAALALSQAFSNIFRASLSPSAASSRSASFDKCVMVSVSKDASTKVSFIFNSARGVFSTWSRFWLFNSFSKYFRPVWNSCKLVLSCHFFWFLISNATSSIRLTIKCNSVLCFVSSSWSFLKASLWQAFKLNSQRPSSNEGANSISGTFLLCWAPNQPTLNNRYVGMSVDNQCVKMKALKINET